MLALAPAPAVAEHGPRPNWFVALPLPPQARWQEVTVGAPAALRRFAAEDLHLTLAFLGPCGEARALAAWDALGPLTHPPLTVTAGAWRALGRPQQPSAYGLTLAQGERRLVALLRAWGGLALQAAGCPPESRPPLPHVTLLRPRRREAAQLQPLMAAWMAAAALPPSGAELQELALYTWAPDRRQRLFQPVDRRALG